MVGSVGWERGARGHTSHGLARYALRNKPPPPAAHTHTPSDFTRVFPPEALRLLGISGTLYVTGVIFYAKGVTTPIYHVVFHMFVLVAAAVHWWMVYRYILPMDVVLS